MLLLLPLTFPALFMVTFGAPSHAAGLVVLSALYIPYGLISRHWVNFNKIYLIYLFLLLVWGGVAAVIEVGEIGERQVYSYIALAFTIGVAAIYIDNLLGKPFDYLKRAIYLSYGLLIGFGAVALLNWGVPGSYVNLTSPVFPFAEPSHFALVFSFVSSLMICLVKGFKRYFIVLVALAFALLFPNATLLVGAIFLTVTCITSVRELAIAVAVLICTYLLLNATPDTFEYFDSRLFGSVDKNLSTLVYEQGWEAVAISLESTNYIGLGFQNLGLQASGAATFSLDGLIEVSLNRLDGGFLFSKIVSEFGIAGAAFCAFFCYNAIRSLIIILQHNASPRIEEINFSRHLVPACSCFMFLIELFVRGVGYFSPTFIFMVCCSGLLVNIGKGSFAASRGA